MSSEPEGLEVLTAEECLAYLSEGCVGRVGLLVDGRVEVLPVNYAADGEGTVVFRTTPTSALTKVHGQAVVFEVDGFDEASRTGWSVCVHGPGREITAAGDPTATRLTRLSVIPWAAGDRDRWFAITPGEITGRRIPLTELGGWLPGVVS